MRYVVLSIIFLLSVMLLQAQVVELDIQKCRRMANENSKKLQSATQQEAKASFEKRAYRANFLPKISATGLYTYMQKKMDYKIEGGYLPVYQAEDISQALPLNSIKLNNGQPVIGTDGLPVFNQYAFMPDINLSLGLRSAYTVGMMLEQPLYMGGKVRSAFRMASIGREMAGLNVVYNRMEVLTEVDEAYCQYLRVLEQEKAAGKYLEVVKELVRNVADAVQTGMASTNDLLKAQVKENEAELLVSKATNGLALSSMNLCRVIGIELNSQLLVRDSLEESILPGILEGKDGITGRPEYNILEKQVEMKENEVALVRSDFMPQLGLAATYGYGDGLTLNGESEGVASFGAMVSLKVPIYNWGEGRNKVKAMKAEEEMARLKQEETAQLMHLEVARARYNTEDAMKRVQLTRKSLSQAEENLQVSKNRYEVGLETITNYMEAQAQWQKAWSDWIDARAELRLSETYFLKATGRLTE